MHKFYWHNNSHAAGGGSGGGNGSNRARQQAGGSHGSSQQQQTSAASLSPRVGRGGNASSSSCVAGMRASDAPSVPHRNGGITVRVKTTDNGGCEDDTKSVKSHAPSGSHRVLLKLRRMSGGGSSSNSRPKSVSDASEIPGSVTEIPAENPGSRMRGSRSMHQMFHYNKTWNERSLSKCLRETEGGQHNYENIYSGDKDSGANSNENNPLYENVAYHQYQYPFVSLGNPAQGENSLVIGQLTKSPRSTARSRRNNNNSNSNGIFRSKSCERPKMRDAVRETQQHLVSNFNRLLQNRFGVGISSGSNNNNGSALTTSASMFMGSDSSGYKSFHSGADDLQPQVRQATERSDILSWIYGSLL